MEFSKCYNKDGNDDGTYSKFLEEQVSGKGAQRYRFMLNWIILIAFHWYYIQKDKLQQNGLIDCGEFIEHLYHTFIGWMEKMDSQALNNVFNPKTRDAIDYKSQVESLIDSNFKTDSSLKSLINGIRQYLCIYTKKEKRVNANQIKTKGPAAAESQKKYSSQRLPPPRTEPPSIALESESESESESASSKLEPLFIRTGRAVVPPLKVTGLTSQSGPQTDRQPGFNADFNLRQAIKYGSQAINYGRRNAVGIGSMGPLPPIDINDKPQFKRSLSGSVIQTPSPLPTQSPTQSPTPPTNKKPNGSGLSVTQKRHLSEQFKGSRKGGHKRTRKHRSAASSTPAPPTRRHRDHSSSTHKRTRRRRQRPQRREH
jgi:hypothetical protein